MPLDTNKRFDELLKDNPYAAEYGIGAPSKPPSIEHLTEPLPAPRPDPTRPSEAGPPSIAHLTEPLEMPSADADPSADYINTPEYKGPGNQNYLQQGVNAYTRSMTSGALDWAGDLMKNVARDPLGPLAGAKSWLPYGMALNAYGYRTPLQMAADAVRPEQPIGLLQRAGEATSELAASPELGVPPGWKGGLTETFGRATGSMLPSLAMGAVTGGPAGIALSAITSSYVSAEEQVEEALRNGATPEQIKQASRMASVGGFTEPVPIEVILNRIPVPLWGKAIGIFGKLAKNAAAEGGQEALQQLIQNFSEKYVYNPNQDLTEGMATSAGVGAVLGAGAGAATELATEPAPAPVVPPGGTTVPPPGGTPGVTPPAPGVTSPAPGAPPAPGPAPPSVTSPAPGVTPLPVIPTAPTVTPGAHSTKIPPPAPIITGEEEELPPLPPEEEEPVVPEPVVAPDAELPTAPEQPLEVPPAVAPAPVVAVAPPAAPLISTPSLVPEQQQPLGPTTVPRTPSQVQQATGVPYAEAARVAESEGWRAPTAPEPAAPTGPSIAHLTEPLGTRRTPMTGAAGLPIAGDRVNLKATDAQRRVKNAEIGHYSWQGRGIGIEVPTGGLRRSTPMPGRGEPVEGQLPDGVAYGRFKRTRSRKAEVKVFVGPQPDTATHAYVIDQIDPTTGKYDEPKTFVGFPTLEDARNAYISSYSDGRGAERIGSISELPIADFKKWLTSDRTTRPYDRKATAASRRLRQAYTAEAQQAAKAVPDEGQAAPPAGPAPDTSQPDAAQAGVAPEQGEVQGAGQEVQPEAELVAEDRGRPVTQAELVKLTKQYAPDMHGRVSTNDGGKRVFFRPKRGKQTVSTSGMPNEYGEVIDTLKGFQRVARETEAERQATQPKETEDAGGISQDSRQPDQEGHAPEGGEGPRGPHLERGAQGQPSDRAPQREEKQPAQQEGLAARWDKLPLEQKETLLKAAKVSRSPISRWKDFGEANQQKLQAAEAPQEAVSEKQASKAKPAKETEPTLADQFEDIAAAQNEALGIIQRIAGRIRVNFKDALEPTSAEGWGGARATEGPAGTFEFWRENGRMVRRLIEVSLDQSPADIQNTAFHEAWHAIERAIGRANMRVMKAEMPRLRKLVAAELRRLKITDIDASKLSEQEVMAIAFARYGQGRVRGIHTGIRRYFEAVKQFLRRLGNALRSGNFKTAEDVFGQAYEGKFAGPLSKQDLTLFDQGRANVQATLKLGRRPIRPPSPGATFTMPEDRIVAGVNVTELNRGLAYRAESAERVMDALKATGQPIHGDLDLRQAITLYESSTDEKSKALIERRVEPIKAGLRSIGETMERFDQYLYAQSAIHENPRLRAKGALSPDPSGMSDVDAQDIINNAHPEFANLAQHVYAMNAESLWQQYRAGLIDQATYNELATRSHYWVPHRGWEQGTGDDFAGTGQGFDLRGPAFRRRLGRFSKADSPLAWSIQAAHAGVVRSSKNRVGRTLLRLVRQFKNDAFWTVDRAAQESYEHESTDPTTGVVTREIRQRWVPPAQLARKAQGIKDTIVTWENGVPHYITIHHAGLLTALRTMGAEESNTLLRGLGKVTQIIGKLYTTWNPNFVIRNFFRDLETAMINMGEENVKGLRRDVLKTMPSATTAMWKYLRKTDRPPGAVSHTVGQKPDPTEMLQYAHDFAMDGGKISWVETKSIEQQKRDLRKAINSKNHWHKARAAKDYIKNGIEDINGSVENAVRLGLYVELRKRGYTRARAAATAKEITVNFNTKGTMGQAINSLFMFFNARVQGNKRVIKAIGRSKKVQAAVGGIMVMGFLMDFINRWAGGDDDEGMNRWDNVPQWEKERNLIFMWNDAKIKIPLSFGYNFFYVAGQQMASAITNMSGYGQGTEPLDAAWNIMHAGINATSPIDIVREGYAGLAPTLAAPFIEMAENLNYQGAPIYPTKYDPKDPDAQLYFKSVPKFWKDVAADLERYSKIDARKPALIDVSPESLQHLFNTYFGGAGQFGFEQIVGNAVKLANAGLQTLQGKPTALDIEARDIPIVREVYGSADTSFAKQNVYYDVWDKVDQLHRSMTEEGVDSKEREAIKRRYPLEAGVYNRFKDVEKQLREQRARRKKIEANDRLSSTERQRRLDAVETKMEDLRSGALAEYARQMKQQQGATLH